MKWNWHELGREVERARRACVATWQPGHREAAERFQRAIEAVWPPGFAEKLEQCRRGEPDGLNDVLDFVESCPRFFRSGYVLGAALRFLPRPPRSPAQAGRMRDIVLASVAGELRVPFERIPSLGRAIASTGLREELLDLHESPDEATRKRAIAVLDRLPGPPWDPERDRTKRADDRLGSMIVTAQRRRSPVLLRRVLQTDPQPLSSRGRHHLAVAFEFALNWGLLPDDELLEIARRIDGPEMAAIWSYALRRSDTAGDRARWLRAQLREPWRAS